MGTAIAGTILISDLVDPKRSYALAMVAIGLIGLIGLGATLRLPRDRPVSLPAATS
jgi:hypothetical protein